MLRIDETQLLGLVVECILYGVYLVSLGFYFRILYSLRKDRGRRTHLLLTVATVAFAIAATLDIVFTVGHAVKSLVDEARLGPPGLSTALPDWASKGKVSDEPFHYFPVHIYK